MEERVFTSVDWAETLSKVVSDISSRQNDLFKLIHELEIKLTRTEQLTSDYRSMKDEIKEVHTDLKGLKEDTISIKIILADITTSKKDHEKELENIKKDVEVLKKYLWLGVGILTAAWALFQYFFHAISNK